MHMPDTITGYAWSLNGTAHVNYSVGDNHIHEMVANKETNWRDFDVTRVAGGPELEDTVITGYDWPDGRTKHINYTSTVDSDGHIYELTLDQNGTWSNKDLMKQVADAPLSDGSVLIGYAWIAGKSRQVVYLSPDSHIHELSVGVDGMWHHSDLTQLTGAPLIEDVALAAYEWKARGTKEIFFKSADGRVHELMTEVGGPWRHTDLTNLIGVPLAQGPALAGYAWKMLGTKQVVFVGTDGDIYELAAGTDNRWRYANLTEIARTPLMSGSALTGFAWETGLAKQVVYVGTDHHVHELMDGGEPGIHTDLTQMLGAPEASDEIIVAYELPSRFAKHIIFLDTKENPHIHAFMLEHGGSWQHRDLTSLTGAPELV
jgi:hypothetical protein